MSKPSTGESPPQLNEHTQPRRRNIYDCDGEYEFPTVQHWTAKSFEHRPHQVRLISNNDEKADIVGTPALYQLQTYAP